MARCECSPLNNDGTVEKFHTEANHEKDEKGYLGAGKCTVKNCNCQKFKTANDKCHDKFVTLNHSK